LNGAALAELADMNTPARMQSCGALVLTALLGAIAGFPAHAAADDQRRPATRVAGNSAVRTTAPFIQRMIDEGIRRSPTFASEMRDLAASDVIAIVETSRTLPTGICGHMVFMAARGGFRYVQIQIDTKYNLPQTIGIIGHELRHALEVAAHPDVVDQASLRRMYERIGRPGLQRTAAEAFDSVAAINTGRTIVEEMLSPPVNAATADGEVGR
jgi:hypothetical protein